MINLLNLVEGRYDYGCVMARIDEESARLVLDFNYKTISEDLLYQEGPDFGREQHPHITIKYGLVNSYTEDQMRQMLSKVTPFDVQVKGISLFEGDDRYDVVKFDIESPTLHKLHEQFSYLPNHDSHLEYHPHMTLAYVRRGMGNRFIKNSNKFARVPVNCIVYSDRGEKFYYNLKNSISEKVDSPLIRKLESDISKLEQEWDRLDSMGNQESRQQQIAIQLEKLRKEKTKWENLYGATL